MNDLLKKLNTLARSKISDITPTLPRFERAPDLDRQANELRQRINDALDHEDKLQAAAQALRDEVTRLDRMADEAVAQGRDAEARHLLEQLKRTEQRLSIAESDLRAHQRSAEELIQRVNMLEAAIADNRAANQPQPAAPPAPDESAKRVTIPVEDESGDEAPVTAAEYAEDAAQKAHQQAEKTENAVQRISSLIKEAQDRTRERISMMGELLGTKEIPQAAPSAQPASEDDSKLENIRPRSSMIAAQPPKVETESPTPEPSAEVPPVSQPVQPESEPASGEEDAFAKRLKRLSKPE